MEDISTEMEKLSPSLSEMINWDCSIFDQFLHEGHLELFGKEPEKSEDGIPESQEKTQGQLGHTDEVMFCLRSSAVDNSSPENEQSFFSDFEHKISEKNIANDQILCSLAADSDIVGVQGVSLPSSVSDLNRDGDGDSDVAAEAVGGSNVDDDDCSHEWWFEEMNLRSQMFSSESGLADGNTYCNSPEVNPMMSSAIQEIPVSCEHSCLLNTHARTWQSQSFSNTGIISPCPSTNVGLIKNVKVKEENCNKNDEAEEKKKRRRMQNRTAARRCRTRKKKCFESMVEAIQKATLKRCNTKRWLLLCEHTFTFLLKNFENINFTAVSAGIHNYVSGNAQTIS